MRAARDIFNEWMRDVSPIFSLYNWRRLGRLPSRTRVKISQKVGEVTTYFALYLATSIMWRECWYIGYRVLERALLYFHNIRSRFSAKQQAMCL